MTARVQTRQAEKNRFMGMMSTLPFDDALIITQSARLCKAGGRLWGIFIQEACQEMRLRAVLLFFPTARAEASRKNSQTAQAVTVEMVRAVEKSMAAMDTT